MNTLAGERGREDRCKFVSFLRIRSFPCGLRGPVTEFTPALPVDLHRPRFAPPLETTPSRHFSAHYVSEKIDMSDFNMVDKRQL